MRIFSLLLSCVMLTVLEAPAFANWQSTRWGMSIEQVIGAVPTAVRHTDLGMSRGDEAIKAVALYNANGIEFVSFFYFSGGEELSSVHLIPKSQSDCGKIIRNLAAAYGEPGSKSYGRVIDTQRWRDLEKGNMVGFTRIGSECSIAYWPVASGAGL